MKKKCKIAFVCVQLIKLSNLNDCKWLVKLFLRSPWCRLANPKSIHTQFSRNLFIQFLQTLNTTNYRCHGCLNNWGVCVNRKSVSPNRLLNMRSGLESHCEFFQVNNIIQQIRPIILLSWKESIRTITFCVPSTPPSTIPPRVHYRCNCRKNFQLIS